MLAQTIFEIYDVELVDVLERPDIESIYRMMYDCEEHDEFYVNKIPFAGAGTGAGADAGDLTITKKDFCEYCSKKKHIIQPALDYQKRLRSKMGGYILWENLSGFRRRMFLVYDTKASSTKEAVLQIVASEDPNRKARKQQAQRLLEEKRLAQEALAAAADEELKAIERSKEEEKRRKEMNAEDRFLKLYWLALDEKRKVFEQDEFLVEDSWRRKEAKEELYGLLDSYKQASDEYWSVKDEKERLLMCGTDEDHEARYKDYIKVLDGQVTYEYTRIQHALNLKEKDEEEKFEIAKSKNGSKRKFDYCLKCDLP
jgi:hypothetical protein